MKNYTIAVAGTGYVGLSIATLLSQHHKVYAVDIIPEKVELINSKKSPIQDEYIEKYLSEKELDLTATLDAKLAYSNADFVVIAAPTNYDSQKNFFDTSAVETVIKLVMEYNPNAIMVIKSTIPVGYTKSIREKTGSKNIIFSPEFLRESKALYDNLYPSRIIVGTDMEDERLVEAAHEFAALLQEGAIKENIDTLFMGFTEAEAVKGKVNLETMKEYLYASDLGIMPYEKKDNFYYSPLKMYDMIGAGLPFIGTKVGQIEEYSSSELSDDFLCNNPSVDSFCAAIINVKSDNSVMENMQHQVNERKEYASWERRSQNLLRAIQ